MKKNTALISTIAAVAGGAFLYENYTIEVDKFVVFDRDIPKAFDGYKILQLSDFHNKNFGLGNKKLYKKIHKINPDIILMTGDMVSRSDKTLDRFYALAQEIGHKYQVYYTVGNHELDLSTEELSEMFAILRGYGIIILNNERAIITRDNESISIYGMWYSLPFYKNENGNYRKNIPFSIEEMDRILGEKTAKDYTVLLAHNPADFEIYAKWGADLTFSGHVHGGVIRLPVFGGVLSPGRRFFPKYYDGAYKIHGKRMLVSRGIGGIRMLNKPSLLVAILKSV